LSEPDFRRALLAGYPDRVAQRREAGSPNVRLASGAGATIAPESGVRDGEFLIALDVSRHADPNVARHVAADPRVGRGRTHGSAPTHVPRRTGPVETLPDASIRIASRVEREWLKPTATEVVHHFDKESGKVRATVVDRYDAIVLAERPAPVDPELAAQLLADAWLARGPREEAAQLLRRLRFAGRMWVTVLSAPPPWRAHSTTCTSAAPAADSRDLDKTRPVARRPQRLTRASGTTRTVASRLRETGGLSAWPRRRAWDANAKPWSSRPRPTDRCKLTRDLRSFWIAYPEVRKELRGVTR
jgi:ATP-dependent helicase HrpB